MIDHGADRRGSAPRPRSGIPNRDRARRAGRGARRRFRPGSGRVGPEGGVRETYQTPPEHRGNLIRHGGGTARPTMDEDQHRGVAPAGIGDAVGTPSSWRVGRQAAHKMMASTAIRRKDRPQSKSGIGITGMQSKST